MKNFLFIIILIAVPLLSQNQAWWEPDTLFPGDSVTIYYNTKLGTLPDNSSWIKLHWGINDWTLPPESLWLPNTTLYDASAVQSLMTPIDDTIWSKDTYRWKA